MKSNALFENGLKEYPAIREKESQLITQFAWHNMNGRSGILLDLISSIERNEITDYLTYLKERIKTISHVEKVFQSDDGGVMHLYFVYPGRNKEEQKKIYDIQLELIRKFKDRKFAFHDVTPGDRPLETMINPKSVALVYDRKS